VISLSFDELGVKKHQKPIMDLVGAVIDAFWSREPSTVESKLYEAK
jgi:hypothetical protein